MRALYVSRFDSGTSSDGFYADLITTAMAKTGKAEIFRGPIQVADGSGLDAKGSRTLGPAIARRAAELRVDVVHLHYEPGLFSPLAVLGIALSANRMPPLVVTLHRVCAYGGRATPKGIREARGVAQEWLLARKAALLLVHAQHSKDVLTRRYPQTRAEVHSMPTFPDDCDTKPALGGPIIFIGNHHPGKGVLEFVRAMALLPDIPALIAGKRDPQWKAYDDLVDRELARTTNIKTEFGWTNVERKHEMLRGSSAVALPYNSPGSGSGVLQDAISHGRPVVASMAQPLRSLVEEREIGKVVDPASTANFADALQRVATADPSTYRAALDRARDNDSIERVATRVVELYGTVMR